MKWIVRIIGLVMVVIVVAVVGVLMLPAEKIAGIAAAQLHKATGRDVTISGDVGLTFWPVVGLRAGVLEVGNADWAKNESMLSTKNAAIGLNTAALLRGEIAITNIEAQSPVIRLQSRKDGSANWLFSDGTGAAAIETETSPTEPTKPISIQKLKVTDATLIYDAEGSDLVSYQGVDLSLDWPHAEGPAEIAATVRPAGAPLTVAATIQDFSSFLDGESSALEAQLSASEGNVSFAGQGSLQGALAGAFTLKSGNTGAYLGQLGVAGVSLPKGLGQSLDVRSDMNLSVDRELALRNLVADLGGNTIRGSVDLGLNGTPTIRADLNAGALDLSDSGGDGKTSGGDSGAGSGWSKAPIDASGLAAFNGVIGLKADSIDLGVLKFGASQARLSNDRARLVFDLVNVTAYQGKFSGQFVMNNRNGLSVGGNLQANGVEMRQLFGDLIDVHRLSGRGNARLSFLGVGQNVDAIMHSLSGEGGLAIGRGAIDGIDLDALLGSFDVEGGTTVFDQLDVSFAIKDGVLRSDDLLMSLPNFNATGAGQVDLGDQSMDYTLVPKLLKGNQGRGIAVPLRISGPWAGLSYRPDVQAAVDLNLAEEKAQAEAEIKARVEKKLEEELGVARQEGQSVEDAVKDQVEDKLKQELLKFFD